jgi:peptidoglycan/LPS O-acetylase OafA/YrhL
MPVQARPRFAHLDGLRGIAASYVVLFHALACFTPQELPLWARVLRRVFAYGHEAVALFIVLSGYSLMLPVLGDRRVVDALAPAAPRSVRRLGARRYLLRRARRILPPYYAALGLSLALIAATPALQASGSHTIWDDSLPAFESGPLLSHLVLVHNWLPTHAFRINGPLWSVASEWQIYFFFPFVLLPVWRRWGAPGLLAVALLLGYAPLLLWPGPAQTAVPWYLFLFAQGMLAAQLSQAAPERRPGTHFGRWALWSWSFCFVFGFVGAPLWFRLKPLTDALVGAATSLLLIHAAERARSAQAQGWLLRGLCAGPVLALGHVSYSLYLTHLPVVALCYFALVPLALPLPLFLCGLGALGFAASWVVACVFYRLVERHFVTR